MKQRSDPATAWHALRRRLGAGLLLSLLVIGGVGAQQATEPLRRADATRDGPVVLEGKVAEIFGNRFILDAAGERCLVEPATDPSVLSASVGDSVSVEGQRSGALIKAERVLRGTEAILSTAAAAPSPAVATPERTGITAILQDLGLTPIGAPVRKKQHTEILARMPDGRMVYVSLDRSNRLWEIEDAEHEKKRAAAPGLTRDDYVRLAREAGFSPTGDFEQKGNHVELEVTNRRGERLELHMDLAGTIYKQIWLR